MAIKSSELAAALGKVADQINKGIDEVVAQVKALTDALSDAPISGDAQTALDRLNAAAQKLDDLNPDVVTPPPTT